MPALKQPYRKNYNIRRHGPGQPYLEVTLPNGPVTEIAAGKGLNLDEFIKKYGVIVEFSGDNSILMTFAEKIKRKRG
ncbi:MAG: hypothetical protein U1B77_00375 [Dehalococcoidales bacterium]|nr:hypothetical protein [Dehalococcoidales bacterium]